jgi:uncharacterized protein YndB with AHSA1/START domain
MTERHATHTTFAVERAYPHPPAAVFAAWADKTAKQTWQDDPDLVPDGTPYELDFRPGGREHFSGMGPDGTRYRYDAVIHDIAPQRRIVYSYEMHADDVRISVSLVTVELIPDAGATRLVYTEQAAFLNGIGTSIDEPEYRRRGTEWHLDGLRTYLAGHEASERVT